MIAYCGIGSRETPMEVLDYMEHFARAVGSTGKFILRSGGAKGADTAFENGVMDKGYPKEIFVPWIGYNGRLGRAYKVPFMEPRLYDLASRIAESCHPNWNACSKGVKTMHIRNVAQVLGGDLKDHSRFVVCWTKGGLGQGGTGQAIRIARKFGVPVFDLGSDFDKVRFVLEEFCQEAYRKAEIKANV